MNYELSFLTPNIPLKEKEKLMMDIEKEIQALKGNVQEKFSEKKNFAYPVKKQTEGFLIIFSFSLEPKKIINLKKFITSQKNIIREVIEKKLEEPQIKKYKAKPAEKTYKKEVVVQKNKKAKIEDLDKKLEEILK